MIYCFITRYSPDEVRLLLCDSENDGFELYKRMPHLLTGRIVTETEQMLRSLRWAITEMERRYRLFEEKIMSGNVVRNIDEYNAECGEKERKLPRIVIIVKECFKFMLAAQRDMEDAVQRLAQKSRAAGIHLVFSTKVSTPEILSRLLRSNFPTRIAFRVTEKRFSYVLLDEDGAENLKEKGDMLMRSEFDLRCERIRGASLSREALSLAVAEAKAKYKADFNVEAKAFIDTKIADEEAARQTPKQDPDEEVDPHCIKALAVVIKEGTATLSLVQRKCGVGYNHAGKIIEWMENKGYISPFDGTHVHRVLITQRQFIKKYGPLE